MIDIVYPLKRSKWGKEILYSLRSLDMYFKTPFRLHVCGDYMPEWLRNTYFHRFECDSNASTEQNIGPVLKYACESFNEFIWMSDDMYFLKETHIEDLRPYAHIGNLSKYLKRGHSRWQNLLWDTYDMLAESGISPVWNYSTHMPIHYNSDDLFACSSDFPIFSGQALHETVYHNIFNVGSPEKLTDKAGFYNKRFPVDLECGKYRVLNHDDNGLTDSLKNKIQALFSKKSKFER